MYVQDKLSTSDFPIPAITIPAVIMPSWFGRPNRLEGPVRNTPTVRITYPASMKRPLSVLWGIKKKKRVTTATMAVK